MIALDDEVETIEKNPKLKSLYRVIAKTTHPDKINDDSLKELYLEATKAYENNNLLPIISICDKLKIPYEVDDGEFEFIKEQIEYLKKGGNLVFHLPRFHIITKKNYKFYLKDNFKSLSYNY